MNYLNKSFDGIFKIKKNNSQKSAGIFQCFLLAKINFGWKSANFENFNLFHPFGLKDSFLSKSTETVKISKWVSLGLLPGNFHSKFTVNI